MNSESTDDSVASIDFVDSVEPIDLIDLIDINNLIDLRDIHDKNLEIENDKRKRSYGFMVNKVL
jgi:hypothetical protein